MNAGPGDLECRELVELVTDYLEGALAPDERVQFELHLAVCDGCTAYLRQLRATLRWACRPIERSLPEGVGTVSSTRSATGSVGAGLRNA